jgi:hypothetical protein
MSNKTVILFVIAGLTASSGVSYAQTETEQEVIQTIVEDYEYGNTNLVTLAQSYSRHGALEFWSSGGLLHEIPPGGGAEELDAFNIQPKHIKVITLVEGQAAVAHFYAEGSLKPKGASAVDNYLVRATVVYVKEDGAWKIRSSHYSAITGGLGTSQTAQEKP